MPGQECLTASVPPTMRWSSKLSSLAGPAPHGIDCFESMNPLIHSLVLCVFACPSGAFSSQGVLELWAGPSWILADTVENGW